MLSVFAGVVWVCVGYMCDMCFHMQRAHLRCVFVAPCACVGCDWNVACIWEVMWYGSMCGTWNDVLYMNVSTVYVVCSVCKKCV